MRNASWDRDSVISDIRDRIWHHLSPSAETAEDVLLDAAALLQLSSNETLRLAEVHFLLSDEVERLLKSLPALVRRLPPSTLPVEVWSADRVAGPIHWPKTFAARSAGNPGLFVTTPSVRAYDTPPTSVLVNVLERIIRS